MQKWPNLAAGVMTAVILHTTKKMLALLAGALFFISVRGQTIDSAAAEKIIAGQPAAKQARLLDSLAEKISSEDIRLSISFAERALSLTENSNGKERALALKTMSRLMRRTGQTEKAVHYADEGIRSASAIHDTIGVYECLLQKGSAYYASGDYKNALIAYTQLKDRAQQAKHDLYVAKALNNTGNVYFRQELLSVAEKFYEDSRQVYVRMGDKNGEALQLDNIALVYSNQGKYDKSFDYHMRAIEVIRKMNDPSRLATSYNEVGSLFIHQKKFAESEKWLLDALRLSESARDEDARLSSMTALGEIYIELNRYEEAAVMIDSALDLSRKLSRAKHELSGLISKANLEERRGTYAGALNALRRHMKLNDSLNDINEIREMAELNARYDTEKKDRQIVLLNKESERQRLRIYLFLAGIILGIISIALVIRNNLRRRAVNRLLSEQHEIISQKGRDMTDSINYARRIQTSMLPADTLLEEMLDGHFIFYRPRDIVSGDFFWIEKKGERLYIAAADCTGHGVPGALVSIVGMKMLRHAVHEPGVSDTGAVLSRLHQLIIRALNKNVHERESNDGMDIGLLCIDFARKEIEFSGAARPLYCFGSEGENIVKGDRFSVAGNKSYDDAQPYTVTRLPLRKGMMLYLSTDGFADQFGGPEGKKLQSGKLVALLRGMHREPPARQAILLRAFFENWQGGNEQVDDVLIIGIKI